MTNASPLQNLAHMTGLSEAELQRRAEQLVDIKTGKIRGLSALDAALVDAAIADGKAPAFQAVATADPHAIDEPTHAYTHGVPMAGFAPEAPQPPSIGGPLAQLERQAKTGAHKIEGFCGGYAPPAPPPAPPPRAISNPESPSAPGSPSAPEVPAPPAVTAPPPAAPPPPAAGDRPPATGGRVGTGPLTTSSSGGARKGFVDAPSAGGVHVGPSSADTAAASGQVDSLSRDMQFELIKNEIQKMSQIQQAMSNVVSTMSDEAQVAIRNTKA